MRKGDSWTSRWCPSGPNRGCNSSTTAWATPSATPSSSSCCRSSWRGWRAWWGNGDGLLGFTFSRCLAYQSAAARAKHKAHDSDKHQEWEDQVQGGKGCLAKKTIGNYWFGIDILFPKIYYFCTAKNKNNK